MSIIIQEYVHAKNEEYFINFNKYGTHSLIQNTGFEIKVQSEQRNTQINILFTKMCVCMYISVCVCAYRHTYTHGHIQMYIKPIYIIYKNICEILLNV